MHGAGVQTELFRRLREPLGLPRLPAPDELRRGNQRGQGPPAPPATRAEEGIAVSVTITPRAVDVYRTAAGYVVRLRDKIAVLSYDELCELGEAIEAERVNERAAAYVRSTWLPEK